jgi:hypothetical protein
MRVFETMGYLEVDWESGEWSTSPTTLTLLPDAGGHALLTGARTGSLREHLINGLFDLPNVFVDFTPQEAAPDSCYVAGDSERDLEDLAAFLGISFEYGLAERLIGALPGLDAMLHGRESTRGVPDLGVTRLDVDSFRWRPVGADEVDGLYQYERIGRRELRWICPGSVFRVSYPLGVYCELRRTGLTDKIKWWGDAVNGTLGVPLEAPLPALHRRAAAMCSGVVPFRQGRVTLYRNVPLAFAEAVATSLGQGLVSHRGRASR